MLDIRAQIQPPYFFTADELPGIDFNREIVEPGEHEGFPEGAVGIRADGDFWTVAALPYSLKEVPLAEIVKQLWPQYADKADLCPDAGSVEQQIYFARQSASSERSRSEFLQKALNRAEAELDRLRTERPRLHEHQESRKRAESSYFIRQYEHLLVAIAHENQPREDAKGICKVCGLYGSDRVHMKHYRDLHDAGYKPDVKHLLDYGPADDL
jgi:hypothetical protein